MKKIKKRKIKCHKWKNRYYVEAYQFAALGYSDKRTAETLGIALSTYRTWMRERPTLRWSVKQGRQKGGRYATEHVLDYIYKRLTDEHKAVYDEIREVDKGKNSYQRIAAILDHHGDAVRKHIFLYALVSSNFNKSEAMRKCCISARTLSNWMLRDKRFAGFMEEVKENYKDFLQSALNKKIKEGDAQAIIFANKTLNRDRGFGEKMEIEHTGKIEHSHMISVDPTKLSHRAQREIMSLLDEEDKLLNKDGEMDLGNGQKLLGVSK